MAIDRLSKGFLAVSRYDNEDVIGALIKSININLLSALDEAMDYGNSSAADKLLRAIHNKGSVPSSENYQKIFQSKFEELKSLARQLAMPKESLGHFTPMKKWEIDKIVEKGDLKTLTYLIDRDINLGYVLIKTVKHIIFAKDKHVRIGNEWYELLDKLSKKDLPAEALEQVLASAIINSKMVIVNLFIKQLPKENQRIRAVIKQNIKSIYSKDSYFEQALSTGSIELVKLYLEEGMPVKREHLRAIPSSSKYAEELTALLLARL